MVAKSFQNLEQIGEPFEDGGKMYVNVRAKKGNLKRVRWYDIDEYCCMYPEADREALLREYDPYWKPLKHVLMGDSGYIKGEEDESIIEAAREWFVVHKLEWDEVGKDDNTLYENVQATVQKKCNGRAAYKWQ